MTRSLFKFLGVFLALLMVLSACASDTTDDTETPSDGATEEESDDAAEEETEEEEPVEDAGGVGGTFVAAVPEDFDAIDPHTSSGETGATWLSLIYETLVGVDQNADVVPGLAESWEVSDDGLTYTFTLREGIMFHNGRELVAEDVKFNYERIADPDTGAVSQSVLSVVSSIETPDDRTVVLQLDAPSAPLLSDLAQQGRAAIVAPESYDDDNQFVEEIGTGPYLFDSYTVNDRLTMTRNPDYWGGPANIETIEVRIVPDATSRLQAIESGDIDMAWAITPTQGFPAAEGGDFQMVEVPQNRANFFGINHDTVDPAVREAMFLAVSRTDIAAAGWDDFAVPTAQPFIEDSFWYINELDTPTDADIEAATALVEEAGAVGTPITVVVWDSLGSDTEAQIVQSAWEEIGLEVSLETVDIGTLVTRADEGDFDVVYLWIGLITDPNRPYGFLESSSARHSLVGNINSDEMDQLVADARQSTDPDERKALYQQALELNYQEEFGQFYTVRPEQYLALSDRVQGYEQGAYYVAYQTGGLLTATLSE